MADVTFVERENASLHAPVLKMRQRLQSAPDNMLRTPVIGKKFHTPLQSGRKALGVVNKITSTPAINGQEKKCQKTQEAKIKCVPLKKVEEYPDIERLIPYDPLALRRISRKFNSLPGSLLWNRVELSTHHHSKLLLKEFEKNYIPEDLIRLSCFALPGLACFPQTPCLPEKDLELLEPYPSPWKVPKRSDDSAAELDAFLQTINELTIDLPPESD